MNTMRFIPPCWNRDAVEVVEREDLIWCLCLILLVEEEGRIGLRRQYELSSLFIVF